MNSLTSVESKELKVKRIVTRRKQEEERRKKENDDRE